MIKLESGEVIPYPVYQFQKILRQQLEISYYTSTSIAESDDLPVSDFSMIYDKLGDLVAMDEKRDSEKLVLLSKAIKGSSSIRIKK